MQWFQTRINHRILGTNWLLNKINSNNNPNCSFCRHSIETIEHLLYECKYVQTLLNEFNNVILQYNILFNHNKQEFIFGFHVNSESKKANNTILLWVQFYIFKTKQRNSILNLVSLRNHLNQYFQIEKYSNIIQGKATNFAKDWQNWIAYFDG